jgi:hypothetical protein
MVNLFMKSKYLNDLYMSLVHKNTIFQWNENPDNEKKFNKSVYRKSKSRAFTICLKMHFLSAYCLTSYNYW